MSILSFLKRKKEGYYLDNRWASIKWNAVIGVPIIKWKRAVELDDFRFICKQAFDLIELHKSTKWYENRSALGDLGAEDKQWFESYFYDKLIAVGVNRQAFLLSQKAFDKVKFEDWLFHETDEGMEIRYFGNKKEAVKWLMRK